MAVVKKCRAAKDAKCEDFQRCKTLVKSIATYNSAVLVAQHALKQSYADQKEVEGLIQVALKSYEPVKTAVEGWIK
jgi:hypothetical protein